MAKQDFNDLLWFLTVAKERSFTKAAAKLGIGQSTLSHTIKRLEDQMGIRLLTRTTRSVGLTEAGERLRLSMAPRIAEIEAEIADLMAFRDKPSGRIRMTVSEHALQSVVWPKLQPILKDYPDIKLELSLDNGFRNIVEDGFDAGVRLGESVEKDMVAVRIGPDWRLVAVGSPGYFAEHGVPEHPHDLVRHNCINLRLERAGGLYAWEFAKDGQELRVRVDGQLTFNTSYAQADAALKGYGIAYVPENVVQRHIMSGDLALVLDKWSPVFDGYHIYYPSRRQNSPAFKVIVDALRHRGE
ncbi:DNA-binding transcriptional LysR family regulator [Bradyrhizobium diazoefficiens]|jgi:DNA-binding transcriptional LysR family regulator|uniref:Transcriptional regulatory protein n=3 Tax=Bradyrhizobium diazoefficiens TaxID=1355477 RepID=Q89G18_BRADU|nr:LysR family transcriptional regulator [Bradyrhizobium diazoefficiens]AND91580.1 LysR family transcriptional regulator [Bradyrhizobium diazoefficiens USDA 110]APO51242.1 LysR family transcriptional regulator [Bradyrhizobium diazoefficiens]KGJ66933.1 putative transcriptional regulatory protein [Bradyrhizobium diazoefficiens SEMIA 5080]KOY11537.1 LysR family transcriptional regulator [Bradyrhizobium diazoefficiens]MBR0864482.1 LysR family transcriptional regulator [Bradyrhizobium diazoefficien